jgi:hypothetical protein
MGEGNGNVNLYTTDKREVDSEVGGWVECLPLPAFKFLMREGAS